MSGPLSVLTAMSGGVDSSVAALLCREAGYRVVGATMRLWDHEEGEEAGHPCCTLEDVEDARAVARHLGIPFYVFNLKDAFEACVMEPFIRAYEEGRTPNPCIDCNRFLKFDKLRERAAALGCEAIATGHYARIERDGDRFLLKKALDPEKDQSYVLYALTQEELAHILFPLGGLTKAEVRQIAEENGFVTARKPESQDICFVPDGDYAGFIERRTGRISPPGSFVDAEGHVLGPHRGIIRYTVGQRRGLGIPAAERLYVTAISPEANTVTLGPRDRLAVREVRLREVNWIPGMPPGPVRCKVRLRYRQREAAARVEPTEYGALVHLEEPQPSPAPGQAAVFYDGDTVLGGGTVEQLYV